MLNKFKSLGYTLQYTSNPFKNYGVYPVALIDGKLFVTNNPDYAFLNEFWGNGFLYSTVLKSNCFNFKTLDTNIERNSTTKIFRLEGRDAAKIESDELGEIIYEHAKEVIDQFVGLCVNSDLCR